MKRSNGFDGIGGTRQAIQILVTTLFLLSVVGCGQRLRRLESNQVTMEEKVDANANRLEIMAQKMELAQNRLQAGMVQMEKSQGQLQAGINEVKRSSEVTLAEAIATRYEQRKLRESNDTNDDKIRLGVTQLKDEQKVIGQSLNQVDNRTREIGAGVKALASDQQDLSRQINGQHEQVAAALNRVQDAQEKTHALSAEGLARAETLGERLAQMQNGQDELQRTVNVNNEKVLARMDDAAQQRVAMQDVLTDTHATSLIIANDLEQIQDQQTSLQQQSRTHAEQLHNGLTQIQTVQTQQNELHELVQTQADRLGEGVADLKNGQARLSDGIQENRELGNTAVAGISDLQDQLESEKVKIEAVQAQQSDLNELLRIRSNTLIEAVTGLRRGQDTLLTSLQRGHELSQTTATEIEGIQDQLSRGVTQLEAVQEGQDGLRELIQARSDQIDTSVQTLQQTQANLVTDLQKHQELTSTIAADVTRANNQLSNGIAEIRTVQASTEGLKEAVAQVQHGQADLAAGIQENRTIAHTIVTEVKKVQAQQEVLRQLIEKEAGALDAALTKIDDRQYRMAVDLEKNWKTVNDIKGDLTPGQLKQVSGSLAAMEGSIAALNGSVASFEKRLAALTDAVQAYQQERASVDKSLTDGLSSLAQALEYVKVNQTVLSHRLAQAREDARLNNKSFQDTLEQLRKASIKAQVDPERQSAPVRDVETDTDK